MTSEYCCLGSGDLGRRSCATPEVDEAADPGRGWALAGGGCGGEQSAVLSHRQPVLRSPSWPHIDRHRRPLIPWFFQHFREP